MATEINDFLVATLQSVFGNLPQLVSKISVTRKISNDEALRYVLDELAKLTSFDFLARNANNWERTEQVEELEAQLRYLKEYYTDRWNLVSFNNRAQRDDLARAKQEIARLTEQLVECREKLKLAETSSSGAAVGTMEELQDKIEVCLIERMRCLQKIEELEAAMSAQRAEHSSERERLRVDCAENAERVRRLNREVEENQIENAKNLEHLRAIGKMLNPSEPDTDRVEAAFNAFAIRVRKQERLLEDLRKLRNYVETEILEHITSITEYSETSCSDYEYVRRATEALLAEKLRLQEELLSDREIDARQIQQTQSRLIDAENLTRSLSASLNESRDRLAALEAERNKLYANVMTLQTERVELEGKISELNLTVSALKTRDSIPMRGIGTQTENDGQGSSNDPDKREAITRELRETKARLAAVTELQVENDNKIKSLTDELNENKLLIQQRAERFANILDASVQTDPNLDATMQDLRARLRDANICIETQDDVSRVIGELIAKRNAATLSSSDLEALRDLKTENEALKLRIERLSCLVKHSEEIDEAIEKAESLTHSSPHDPEIVRMLVEPSSSSPPSVTSPGDSDSSWWSSMATSPPTRSTPPQTRNWSKLERGKRRIIDDDDEAAVKRRVVPSVGPDGSSSLEQFQFSRYHNTDHSPGLIDEPVTVRVDHTTGERSIRLVDSPAPSPSSSPIEITMLTPGRVNVGSYSVPSDPDFTAGIEHDDDDELETASLETASPSVEHLNIRAALPDFELSTDDVITNL